MNNIHLFRESKSNTKKPSQLNNLQDGSNENENKKLKRKVSC